AHARRRLVHRVGAADALDLGVHDVFATHVARPVQELGSGACVMVAAVRVTVVVPCYNAAAFVGGALESALGQSHGDLEVIVVDDGSTDGSWELVGGFGARIRSERIAHGGAARARNHGLAQASGRFVLFLDADDVLARDTIADLLRALTAAPPRSV